jgi:hypothetical protein
MHFTVVSTPSAEAELAQFWLRAIDRNAITRSSAALDRLLRDSPELGQPSGNSFMLTQESLVVRYRFSPDDCLVEILGYELNLS